MPVDLTHLFSTEAKNRKPSKLKTITVHRTPEFAFLAAGIPLSSYFAWDSITATTTKAPFLEGITAKPNPETRLDFEITHNSPVDTDIPLNVALQYGRGVGPQQLRDFLIEHTKLIHKVPYKEWDLITTVGSTQSWDSVLRTFCDSGDSILVEKYAFSSALETALPKGIKTIPMNVDDDGIIPEKLEAKLASWTAKLPKLIYTVPTGQNPTGSCLPAARRKEIYRIAQKYNLLIIEDEPYYFLQMDKYVSNQKEGNLAPMSNNDFIHSLVPSFLSLDVDGRVIRLDSFSKILAPGLRIGWLIGQKSLVDSFIKNFETSIQSPSGFTLAIVYGTLSRWGQDGYLEWLKALRHEYTFKRNCAIDFSLKYLPLQIATVNAPLAGMFFIISFDASQHPEFASKYDSDPLQVENAIYEKTIEYKSVLVPGSWFEVLEEGACPSSIIFFRATYAATDVETLELGLQRFAKAVKEVFLLE